MRIDETSPSIGSDFVPRDWSRVDCHFVEAEEGKFKRVENLRHKVGTNRLLNEQRGTTQSGRWEELTVVVYSCIGCVILWLFSTRPMRKQFWQRSKLRHRKHRYLRREMNGQFTLPYTRPSSIMIRCWQDQLKQNTYYCLPGFVRTQFVACDN